MEHKNWMGFAGESWKEHIDVRSFIQDNYTIYTGDESFLSSTLSTSFMTSGDVLSIWAIRLATSACFSGGKAPSIMAACEDDR